MSETPKSAEELLQRYAQGERDFENSTLPQADLHGADLDEIELSESDLTGANLEGASICDAGLAGVDLRGATLPRAYLIGSRLFAARLDAAKLDGAHLLGADLTFASLVDASLVAADLERAVMEHANLVQADLRYARFMRTELHDVDFAACQFGETTFADADLSSAIGLDTVTHNGPSSIGIDTIYRSQGRIPEPFLRGCGVPDDFITHMRSLVGRPIEFYSCFISYSSKDEEFAKRLYEHLQQNHLRVWFAPEELKGGRKLHEQIDDAIRLYDKLLLILSPHSMGSLWVQREILKARQKEERNGRRVLFPIRMCSFDELRDWECLDSDTGLDLAREVRGYFIPDFSAWKDHAAFEASVTRLIKDLRAEAKGRRPGRLARDGHGAGEPARVGQRRAEVAGRRSQPHSARLGWRSARAPRRLSRAVDQRVASSGAWERPRPTTKGLSRSACCANS
jgi:uncharacterized protein YjbI with pentapeptide repeats